MLASQANCPFDGGPERLSPCAVKGSGADQAQQFMEAKRDTLDRISGAQAYDAKTGAEQSIAGFENGLWIIERFVGRGNCGRLGYAGVLLSVSKNQFGSCAALFSL